MSRLHLTVLTLLEFGNKKVLFYSLSVQYLVVKSACVNAALVKLDSNHKVVKWTINSLL